MEIPMAHSKSAVSGYSPLQFLGSLGAGGLVVSFFMYLMWMTPHKGQPIPSFASIAATWQTASIPMMVTIAVAMAGIAVFAALHLHLLAWNISRYRAWSSSQEASALAKGNAESQLMAIPLTLAMTVNAMFIVGAVFVPGLWEMAEVLFPLALIAFAAVGVYATRIFLRFFTRVVTEGGFECSRNNSLAQMLPAFAFAMVGVGFSASAAMSHNAALSATAWIGASVFTVAAILLGLIALVMGFRAMMEHTVAEETAPTLWIVIPIVTVVGISLYRLNMALAHNFGAEWHPASVFGFLVTLFSIQLLYAALGYAVLRKQGYFARYVSGTERSPGSWALICPGVALFVFANFVINAGLVKIGVLAKFSVSYLALYAPLVVLQIVTVVIFFKLYMKLVRQNGTQHATQHLPAE